MDDNSNHYNIWPSFVDLSISFVVIFALILSGVIYHSAENKKTYDKVSTMQLKIRSEADQLIAFSNIWADSTVLDIQLDESKTIIVIGLKIDYEINFLSASISYVDPNQAHKSILYLQDILREMLTKKENIIGKIMVEGHTDSRPISEFRKTEFKSNWELSAARAGKVVREFLGDNNDGPLATYYKYFIALGYASTQPTNKGMENDRRITIKVTTATADSLANNY